MDEARLRAWRALELGPLWVSREAPGAAPDIAADSAVAPSGQDRIACADGPAADAERARPSPPVPPVPRLAGGVSGLDWDGLRGAVEECRACALYATRTRTVFGVGPRDARWLVIGEAPGAEEDASGEPFVGQAGRLLDAMLAEIDLDRRRNVFIANVVKCRPPGNRNPAPEESTHCLPFLRRQIELLAPDFVLLLGRVAAHALLETDTGIGSLRGRVHALQSGGRSIPAVVTWHPSYLLRKPEDKALAWADLCLAREAFASGAPPVPEQG